MTTPELPAYLGACNQCGTDLVVSEEPRPADAPEDEIQLECPTDGLLCDRGWYVIPAS